MAIFSFNVVDVAGFRVDRHSVIETECASRYVYKISASSNDDIRFSITGDFQDSTYTVLGNETSFINETTVSYETQLYISFTILNSGSSGNFFSANLEVTNDTTSNNYEDNRTRLNDNTPCGLNNVGDKNYVHDQASPSAVWTINHNLEKYCAVVAVDTAGTVCVGQIDYTNTNTLTITFNVSFSGSAYCN